MKKIIFLLPDLGAGGAERVVSLLSSEMTKQGYAASVFMLFGERIAYKVDEKVIIVKCNLLSHSGKFSRVSILRDLLKKEIECFDLVTAISFQDSCLKYLLAASCFLPIKVIATERNNPYRKGNGLLHRLHATWPFFMANHSVFQTPDARCYYKNISDRNCSIIPNPISSSHYRWNGNLKLHKLITVCRLHSQKNLHMAIEIVDKLRISYPDISLDIYGEGEMHDELQNEIKAKDLLEVVRLQGTTNNVQEKMASSSVFILTSDFEGISNSMIEAMSVGMPIVCTDCPIGGAAMMLGNEAGLLSPVRDVDSFVRNIKSIFEYEDVSRKMAENARKKTSDYSIEEISKKWINIAFDN